MLHDAGISLEPPSKKQKTEEQQGHQQQHYQQQQQQFDPLAHDSFDPLTQDCFDPLGQNGSYGFQQQQQHQFMQMSQQQQDLPDPANSSSSLPAYAAAAPMPIQVPSSVSTTGTAAAAPGVMLPPLLPQPTAPTIASNSIITNRLLPSAVQMGAPGGPQQQLMQQHQQQHMGGPGPSSVTSAPSTLTAAERKERNAQQARESRQRKKNSEMHLQFELRGLRRENERLKKLVKNAIPDHAQAIIGECCYKPRAKGLFHGDQSSKLKGSDFELIENLTRTKQAFVITDPRLPDNPIVYASCAFLELTGYKRDQVRSIDRTHTEPSILIAIFQELTRNAPYHFILICYLLNYARVPNQVIGRNCRFLQGPETDDESVQSIREAIATGKDGATCILNYKEDGVPFWNQLFVAALRDGKNQIVNFVRTASCFSPFLVLGCTLRPSYAVFLVFLRPLSHLGIFSGRRPIGSFKARI